MFIDNGKNYLGPQNGSGQFFPLGILFIHGIFLDGCRKYVTLNLFSRQKIHHWIDFFFSQVFHPPEGILMLKSISEPFTMPRRIISQFYAMYTLSTLCIRKESGFREWIFNVYQIYSTHNNVYQNPTPIRNRCYIYSSAKLSICTRRQTAKYVNLHKPRRYQCTNATKSGKHIFDSNLSFQFLSSLKNLALYSRIG